MRARALTTSVICLFAAFAVTPAAFAQDEAGGTEPQEASQSSQPSQAHTGGQEYGTDVASRTQTVPGLKAVLLPNGYAAAPELAPDSVKRAIWAANRIVGKPYLYGGGHNRKFRSRGYDCSGTVSYALYGAGMLKSPLDSGRFMRWGKRGAGEWITVYTNPGHAYVVIAGLRLDTSAAGDRSGAKGPRWRPALRKTRGFRVRHPDGL